MIHITPMTLSHYDDVKALMCGLPGVSLGEADSRESVGRYLARNPGMSFVCHENGRLTGAVFAGHDGRRGYIQDIAVASDCRRQGLAHGLILCVLDALAREGIEKCNVMVFADNAAGQDFWKSIGFTQRHDLLPFSKRTNEPGGCCSCGQK